MKKFTNIAVLTLSLVLVGCNSDSSTDYVEPSPIVTPEPEFGIGPIDVVLPPEDGVIIIDPIDVVIDPIEEEYTVSPLPKDEENPVIDLSVLTGTDQVYVRSDGTVDAYTTGNAVWLHTKNIGGELFSNYIMDINLEFHDNFWMDIYLDCSIYEDAGLPVPNEELKIRTKQDWYDARNGAEQSCTVRNYVDSGKHHGIIQGNFIVRFGDSKYIGSNDLIQIKAYSIVKR